MLPYHHPLAVFKSAGRRSTGTPRAQVGPEPVVVAVIAQRLADLQPSLQDGTRLSGLIDDLDSILIPMRNL